MVANNSNNRGIKRAKNNKITTTQHNTPSLSPHSSHPPLSNK